MFTTKDGLGTFTVKYKKKGEIATFEAVSGFKTYPAYKNGLYFEFTDIAGEKVLLAERTVTKETVKSFDERLSAADIKELEDRQILHWFHVETHEYDGLPEHTEGVYFYENDKRTFLIDVCLGSEHKAIVHYAHSGHEAQATGKTFNEAVRKLFKKPMIHISYPVWRTDKF